MNKSIPKTLSSIKRHHANSVFYKYLKTLSCLLLVPFVLLSILIYNLYYDAAKKDIVAALNDSFIQTTNVFENILSSAEQHYLLCNDNIYVNNYLLMTTPVSASPSASFAHTIYQIKSVLSYAKNSSNYTNSIYLYSFISDYVYSTQSSHFLDEFNDKNWYDYHIAHPEVTQYITCSPDDFKQINLCYLIKSGGKNKGIIVFNINTDVLKTLISGSSNAHSRTFIEDASGNCIFTTIDKNANIESEKNLYTFSQSLNASPYTITTEYDMSVLLSTSQHTLMLLLCLIILAVSLSVLIAIYMSYQYYKSISGILSSIYATNMNKPDMNTTGQNEIEFITENILHYSISHKQIEQELAQKIAYLQKAQTIALQTQFTPHFLFNTLNHISVTLMNTISRNNPASRMIAILADLLTISLDTREYITDIRSELQYARKYIELESIKHDNNFDVIWNIDESLYDYATPKLILQPILENSFKHGINLLRSSRKGIIHISAQKDGESIVFAVADNGVGISEEKLAEICTRLQSDTLPETTHIGLCNVNQRIQLIYSKEYGCSIFSTPPGVTVKISIPAKIKERK